MSTPPSITVHVGGPSGRRTSPELWGLFLEDINDALDGGLNADLVRNGDFEATAADAPGWHALTGWDAEPARAVSVRSDAPLSSTNATFARMTAEGSPVSLRNGGYDPAGMLLRAGRYRLRLAARTVDRGSLDARLVATGGDGVLASAPLALSAPEAGWTWLEADLDVAEEGRAVLDLRLASGVVDVDLVELRPLGEDGSPLLFRPDLVQALAALRPAFVRFPGGCVAHGYGLDNIYHWKRTIGPRSNGSRCRTRGATTSRCGSATTSTSCSASSWARARCPWWPRGCAARTCPGGRRRSRCSACRSTSRTSSTSSSTPTARRTRAGARCVPRRGIPSPSGCGTWASATRTSSTPSSRTGSRGST